MDGIHANGNLPLKWDKIRVY